MTADLTDQADALETLRLAKAEIAKWKAVAEAATEKVQAALGEEEVGTVGDVAVVRWTRRDVTRVDVKALRIAIPPDLLAPYLRTTTERRFELVDD